jgi:hypothetical protein
VEHCARQIVAEKTRLRDEALATEQAAAEAASEAGQPPADAPAEPQPAA